MYAVLVDEKQNLNWTEVPDPVAGENEVLIEIHAAGAEPGGPASACGEISAASGMA